MRSFFTVADFQVGDKVRVLEPRRHWEDVISVHHATGLIRVKDEFGVCSYVLAHDVFQRKRDEVVR